MIAAGWGGGVMAERYDLTGKRVWVAGHAGMLGAALMRRLQSAAPSALLGEPRSALDLRDPQATLSWAKRERPQAVFLTAGTIGGIAANTASPADFLRDNLLIAASVIDAAFKVGVEKLVYVGSAATYPLHAAQPLREADLMSGALEPAHEGYAMAKLSGIKLCQAYRRQHGADFIAALPTNLYGPGDRYDPQNAHVIPALIRKAHEARLAGRDSIEIWGTGQARRDFLYVDDCADALAVLMARCSGETPVNIGSGRDVSIAEVARAVMRAAGLTGRLRFDVARPEGAPRRLLDITALTALGWTPQVDLDTGLSRAYADYQARQS